MFTKIFALFRRVFVGRASALPAHLRLGQEGEQVAADYLQDLGWRIVDRNWSWRRGELDLVAWDGEILVFIEVKTRKNTSVHASMAAVHKKKKDLLRRTAQAYLRRMPTAATHFRFDVVLCCGEGARRKVSHFKNIPLFNKHFAIN